MKEGLRDKSRSGARRYRNSWRAPSRASQGRLQGVDVGQRVFIGDEKGSQRRDRIAVACRDQLVYRFGKVVRRDGRKVRSGLLSHQQREVIGVTFVLERARANYSG